MPLEGLSGKIEVVELPVVTAGATASPVSIMSSLASGLSTAASAITNPLKGIANIGKVTLPLPNPFWKYSSYNYILTLFCVDVNSYNHPDKTYMKGVGKSSIVLRSGGGNPNARVNTDLGKFDFFMDDLVINCKYGFDPKTGSSHAQKLTFTVYEPYSMGIFMIAIQEAAYKMGYKSYTTANFVLGVQFMGEDQLGSMSTIPNTTKYFTFLFNDKIDMEVTEGGAKYYCSALAASESALLHSNINLSSEISFAGRTVQEVLQTHPQSFTAIYNTKLKEIAKANNFYPDEIVILFPQDYSSASASAQTPSNTVDAPTTSADGADSGPDLLKVVGVTRGGMSNTLIQSSPVNEIGSSLLGLGPGREGMPEGLGTQIYDEKTHNWVQERIQKDLTLSTYQMQQDSTIINAINQVLLSSEYAAKALKEKPNELGMRKMWNIIPGVYQIDTTVNDSKTGRKPRLLVYRIVPYGVHATVQPLPGQKIADSKYKQLLSQCVKAYDYIYTGKNTDIISLQLKFANGFATKMASDNFRTGADIEEGGNILKEKETDIVMPDGTTNNTPSKGLQNVLNFFGTSSSTNKKGGGPTDTEAHRAARLFYDSMVTGNGLMSLDMEIHGDPYWLSSSGTGNYIAKETMYANLNTDMSVNIHNSEVHMIVRFKTPTDINATGLYNMNGSKALLQWSGMYKAQEIDHKFVDGKFTQVFKKALKTQIEPNQTADVVYNIEKTVPREKQEISVNDNTNDQGTATA